MWSIGAATRRRALVLVGLLIALVAVPAAVRFALTVVDRFPDSRAIGRLRAINLAQAEYAASCGKGGYAASLDDLARVPRGKARGFIDADLAGDDVVADEYVFTLTAAPEATIVTLASETCNGRSAVSAYFAEAHPAKGAGMGLRSFATDGYVVSYLPSGVIIKPGMRGARPLE